MGLGSVRVFTLKEARERSRLARQQLADDIDPIDARRAAVCRPGPKRQSRSASRKLRRSTSPRTAPAGRARSTASNGSASVETYAYPVIGDLSVAAIETAHVLKVIEPIWTSRTETASRVRGRIEAVLDWAKARQLRQGENPARWRGHLDKLLPAKTKVRKVKHLDAMPYGDVPVFMATLRDMDSVSARALEFTILTAARTGETMGATWSEIDLRDEALDGSGRAHEVGPRASRAALAIAPWRSLRRCRAKTETSMSSSARARARASPTRRCSISWQGTGSPFTASGPPSAIGPAIRPTIRARLPKRRLRTSLGDKTEAAYRRGDALEKRRKLMQAWAGYCARQATGSVVQIRKARA